MGKLIQLICLVSLVCLVGSFVKAEEITTMSYDQIVTSPSQGTTTSKVWIKGNNMRMEQIAEGEKMITLMKEGAIYLYYPSQKMAMKMDISAGAGQGGQENPKDMVEYLKSIEAKPLGQERIEDKLCDVYQITYPQTGLPADLSSEASAKGEASAKAGARGKIWVWRGKDFPLKSVMTVGSEILRYAQDRPVLPRTECSARGEGEATKGETITTEYRNVQMGISIPDSYFEIPPGTQIMDMSQMMPGVIPQE